MGCLNCMKRRSPSPSPPKVVPNLPPNIMRKIASMTNSRTRSSMRTVFGKNQIPYAPNLRTYRRVKKSVPPAGEKKMNYLDMNPIAYKNLNWKYYLPYTRNRALYFNSKNSNGYKMDSKGKKTLITNEWIAARPHLPRIIRTNIKTRKPHHTYSAYLNRVERSRKYNEGVPAQKINNMIEQGRIRNVPLPELIFWYKYYVDPHAYKRRSVWYSHGSVPLNRKYILETIPI